MQDDFLLESYDYHLPQDRIAQHPVKNRDESKLLIAQCGSDAVTHSTFSDITAYFKPNDILVVNDTKVFPARLLGKKSTGGKVEVFLLNIPQSIQCQKTSTDHASAEATALLKSSKRPPVGATITIAEDLQCQVVKHFDFGKAVIRLLHPQSTSLPILLERYGSVPLPPYIERPEGSTSKDRERYQTVYARNEGAVAAPTAGLHFTPELLEKLKKMGVIMESVTLHVGYGTFSPVRTDAIKEHKIHSEFIEISQNTADTIMAAKRKGGRVWAVGTTTVRALEYCGQIDGRLREMSGWCDLYIYPGFQFSIIDNLITNFHLPKSSLLFLVSALLGRERLLYCYKEAIQNNYRFFSYGDAMAILS